MKTPIILLSGSHSKHMQIFQTFLIKLPLHISQDMPSLACNKNAHCIVHWENSTGLLQLLLEPSRTRPTKTMKIKLTHHSCVMTYLPITPKSPSEEATNERTSYFMVFWTHTGSHSQARTYLPIARSCAIEI